MKDIKFWDWFLEKIYKDFYTTTSTYNYNSTEYYVVRINTKQGLYGSPVEIYFDPTNPDSKVLVNFPNGTAAGTKIGRRVVEFFKGLTFKDIEPLFTSNPFNLSFESEKESLNSNSLKQALKLIDKKFKYTKEDISNNRWIIRRDIINFLEDVADYSEFESSKIATTYLNILESGVDINTASQNFSEYENTGTYNITYSKPFVVYFNFEYEINAKDERDAKQQFEEAIKNKELDDTDFKGVRVQRNNLQYGVAYNPYNKLTAKRQIISVQRTR